MTSDNGAGDVGEDYMLRANIKIHALNVWVERENGSRLVIQTR